MELKEDKMWTNGVVVVIQCTNCAHSTKDLFLPHLSLSLSHWTFSDVRLNFKAGYVC